MDRLVVKPPIYPLVEEDIIEKIEDGGITFFQYIRLL